MSDRNSVLAVNADRFHRFCILEQISKPGALQSVLLFGRRLHVLQIKCCQQSGLELALCAAFNKQGGDVLFLKIVAECRFPSGIREDGREDFILFPNWVVFREQGEQLAQRGGSRQKDLAVLQLSEQGLLTEGEYIAGKQSLTEQGVHKLQ